MQFKALQHTSKIWHLPRRLSSTQQPKCHACMLGKATKVRWRVKGQKSHITNVTKPDERVSVDPTPNLIAQLKSILTTKSYKHVAVFVDNYTRFTYMNLQQSNSSKEMLVKFTLNKPTKNDLQTMHSSKIPRQWNK
jgi:hypothetical protein